MKEENSCKLSFYFINDAESNIGWWNFLLICRQEISNNFIYLFLPTHKVFCRCIDIMSILFLARMIILTIDAK